MLTTKTKIAFASLAYRVTAGVRAACGKGDSVVVNRDGFRWSLDLSEGIDFSIYLLGAFERSTVTALKKLVQPGDVVFDIGANIGSHTLGLARSVGVAGKVFAFEPSDFAIEKLKCNVKLNPEIGTRVCLQQILLSSAHAAERRPEIYASWPLKSEVSVHPKHRGRLVSMRNAAVDTIDGFVSKYEVSRLDLIKIDVDGQELPVLQGGLATLQRFKPVLLMEMSPYVHAEQQSSFTGLVELLASSGYEIERADTGKALSLIPVQLEKLIPDGASLNVVARFPRQPRGSRGGEAA